MKIYGKSRQIGYKGSVYDEKTLVAECQHLHLTKSAAEKCGKELAERYRRHLLDTTEFFQ